MIAQHCKSAKCDRHRGCGSGHGTSYKLEGSRCRTLLTDVRHSNHGVSACNSGGDMPTCQHTVHWVDSSLGGAYDRAVTHLVPVFFLCSLLLEKKRRTRSRQGQDASKPGNVHHPVNEPAALEGYPRGARSPVLGPSPRKLCVPAQHATGRLGTCPNSSRGLSTCTSHHYLLASLTRQQPMCRYCEPAASQQLAVTKHLQADAKICDGLLFAITNLFAAW